VRNAFLVVVGLLLFGCSGGGQSSSPAPGGASLTVSGVAATGSAVSGTVYLKDSSGKELSMATTNGTFAFDVSALTPPFMLKASWGSKTMFSFAAAVGTANITPLTQMIVAAAANGGNLAAIYAAADKATFAAVASNLSVATASLRANLKPLLASYSADMDPITGTFAADGTGMDSLLDHVTVTYSSGTVSVTDTASGATLFTASTSPNLGNRVSAIAWSSQQGSVAQDPDVQVSGAGAGLALWWQYNSDYSASTIQAQWLTNGSTPTQISTATGLAALPHVAFDSSGNAIAVWVQSDNQLNNVWVNRYIVGTGWGTPAQITNVASVATSVSGCSFIGVDGAGNAIITWYQENGAINSNHFDVYTSRYSVAGNSWSAPAMLSNGTNSAYGCKVVVNPVGAAALIWVQTQDDGSISNGPSDVWAVTGTTTGGWGSATKLNSSSNVLYGQATVAIDAAGDVLAAWVQNNDSGLFDIWVNHLPAGGRWESSKTITAGNIGECYGPDIAFDGAGNAFAVWEQQSSIADNSQYVAASRYTAGAGWSAPVQINDILGWTFDQHVAVDASGNATAVWYQFEQSAVTVRLNRYLQSSGWGTSQLIATMDSTYDGFTKYPEPRVGVNAGGQCFVVWGTGSN